MVNNQAIFRKGFLNELNCNLVMSSGTIVRFSKNSRKRSRPFSWFFRKSLQSSPLKVSVGSGSFNILHNTWGEREMGEWSWSWIIRWLSTYFSMHHATSSLQLITLGTHLERNSGCLDHLFFSKRRWIVIIRSGPLKVLVFMPKNIQSITTELLSSCYCHRLMRVFF